MSERHLITCSVVGHGNRDDNIHSCQSCYQLTFAHYINKSNAMLLHFYQFESWCLQLTIAESEDTHPIISQNRLDGIHLKICCVSKIILLVTNIVSL